jgi:acetoin utilization deacetylase AcuC-like enzyme
VAAFLITHPDFAGYDDPTSDHPENSARIQAVWRELADPALADLVRLPAPARPTPEADLLRTHKPTLLSRLRRTEADPFTQLDPDTYTLAGSYRIARLATAALTDAVDEVMAGRNGPGIVAVRPPGHHATPTEAMGYCLLNNIAVAANHAIHRHHLTRVMVVDFDVHHGNGTQDIFYADPRVLFVSMHQWPFYPGTGALREFGHGAGYGTTLNVPLAAGTDDQAARRVVDELIRPAAARYSPQLVLVSAGFDGHWRDPLANWDLTLAGYDYIVRALLELAATFTQGRIVFAMEGGYDPQVLGVGMANIARAIFGLPAQDPFGEPGTQEADCSEILAALTNDHPLLNDSIDPNPESRV